MEDTDSEPFEIISVDNEQDAGMNAEVNELVDGIVDELDADGQPRSSLRDSQPSTSRGLSDTSVQDIRFPLEPGEIEPLSIEMAEILACRPSLLRDLDVGGQSPQYSQSSSQGSNVSHASLNEESRYLRYSSFDSTSGGMYSPAGSQPSSQTASLPIQFPNSQETGFEQPEASFSDRFQEVS